MASANNNVLKCYEVFGQNGDLMDYNFDCGDVETAER